MEAGIFLCSICAMRGMFTQPRHPLKILPRAGAFICGSDSFCLRALKFRGGFLSSVEVKGKSYWAQVHSQDFYDACLGQLLCCFCSPVLSWAGWNRMLSLCCMKGEGHCEEFSLEISPCPLWTNQHMGLVCWGRHHWVLLGMSAAGAPQSHPHHCVDETTL